MKISLLLALLLFTTSAGADEFSQTKAQAEQGDVTAQRKLGSMYANGRGVPQDFIEAHAWYNVASANGDKLALAGRDELAQQMIPKQLAEAQRLASEYFVEYKANVVPAVIVTPSYSEPAHETTAPDYARPGAYVSLGVAGALYTEFDEEAVDQLAALGYTVKSKTSVPLGFDFRVGYRLVRHVAVEVHLQYLPNADVQISDVVFYNLETWTLTANIKGYPFTGRIQPYVLVGLGNMHGELRDLGFLAGGSEDGFAVRLAGGVDYYLTDNLALVAELGGVIPTKDVKGLDQLTFSMGLLTRF